MRWVAYMPLRGGSRSIPDKNVRSLAGRPLFAWALGAAVESGCFDAVYAGSDSPRIRAEVGARFGDRVVVLERSAATCSDTASTESALLEFSGQVEFDVLCLVQATSPLTRAEDFRRAKEKFIAEQLDSLLTAVPCRRFFWTRDAQPVNYDPARRPRRQEFAGWLMENGAFYVTRASVLNATGWRLGGRTGVFEMAPHTAVEIDEPDDWLVAEHLLRAHRAWAGSDVKSIRALVLDVDGTLTDGGMYYGADGEALKKFDTRDAHGLKRLRERGIRVCVITAEDSPAVAARMRKIDVDEYHAGVADKPALLAARAKRWKLEPAQIAYVGDDLGDLECLERVGIAFCPADAVPEVRAVADYVCTRRGGSGAVREVCDLILEALPSNGGGSNGAE